MCVYIYVKCYEVHINSYNFLNLIYSRHFSVSLHRDLPYFSEWLEYSVVRMCTIVKQGVILLSPVVEAVQRETFLSLSVFVFV